MSPAPSHCAEREPVCTLVIVERDATCAVCGHPIYAGDEAARWIGSTLAHVACARDGDLSPRGGS
jgi:hypothetical protein